MSRRYWNLKAMRRRFLEFFRLQILAVCENFMLMGVWQEHGLSNLREEVVG